MTNKARTKECIKCGALFSERPGDSEQNWQSRRYCSITCNNRGSHRVTSIFHRLARKQIKKDGCWGWVGSTDGNGYGTIAVSGQSPKKAHRVSFEYYFGPIPPGLNICHSCDNPECTNPVHLFIGTQADNMRDCSIKGRLSKKSLLNLVPGAAGFFGAATEANKIKGN